MQFARVLIEEEPFIDLTRSWSQRGTWPASWVDHPSRALTAPSVCAFRLTFEVAQTATLRLHVSADNRYRLVIDGRQVGQGPERSDPHHWAFETYDVQLEPGVHSLVALTWWLSEQAPYAQMSVRPGFVLAAEGEWMERLSTGNAAWEAALIDGVEYLSPGEAWATGARVRIDGARFAWDWPTGDGLDWHAAVVVAEAVSAQYHNETIAGWWLAPATLPAMLDAHLPNGVIRHVDDGTEAQVLGVHHLSAEAESWQDWLDGKAPVRIPPHAIRRVIIDLQQYACVYPVLRTSGGQGAWVRVEWAESLYLQNAMGAKGHRDEVDGKYFIGGVGDEFLPDGGPGRDFGTLWWECGRYLQITVRTGDAPLALDALTLRETRYPLSRESAFTCDDARIEAIFPIGLRSLQVCAHETYVDCPYYEQLMYVGDTRMEALTTYLLTHDDRLPRKAIRLFDQSRVHEGFTQSRFPSHHRQIIPPFSLWWIGMVHDFWRWRDDRAFVAARLPGVRGVLETFHHSRDARGLISAPNGWNFCDWVPGWTWGIPPDGNDGTSSILNLQYAYALRQKAELEADFGEPLLARRDRELAEQTMAGIWTSCWHAQRGLLADDLAQSSFSEHGQALAIVSELCTPAQEQQLAQGLLTEELHRATIYFSYYLFEALYRAGHGEAIFPRLSTWFTLKDRGFLTTREQPDDGFTAYGDTRSDCHAWGAHPIVHSYTSILGIRPAAPGFRQVRIAPNLGPLTRAQGSLPHPHGEIATEFRREGDRLTAIISLPGDVTGQLRWQGNEFPLCSGVQTIIC